jgi:hypothetical protein
VSRSATKKTKRPATTRVVFDYLIGADDFRTMSAICADTGEHPNRVSAALHHLQKHSAADFVEGDAQVPHWYAKPGDDTRTKVVDEVPEHIEHRAKRRARITKRKLP